MIPKQKRGHNQKGTTLEPLGRDPETVTHYVGKWATRLPDELFDCRLGDLLKPESPIFAREQDVQSTSD